MASMMAAQALDEIDRRVAALRADASRQGRPVLPPLLVLGTSERVGSNWLSDTLRPSLVAHNEPWRQHLGAEHPLSALNPAPVAATDADLDALGRHWLASFVLSKHGPPQHLVEETNLFFATATLLRLFPHAPVIVLSRSPLGVASSFARGGLWTRWRYPDRYTQLLTVARQARHLRWAPLLPDDDPPELVALTRLLVLNAVLLADALTGRDHAHIAYEHQVLDRPAALANLDQLIPAQPTSAPTNGDSVSVDDTFSTAVGKTELTAVIDEAEARLVRAHTATGLAVAATLADGDVVAEAARWLSGDHRYQLSHVDKPRRTSRPRVTKPGRPVTPGYVEFAGLAWRNLLVTNTEFAALLNLLHATGLHNTHGGTHLLLTVMPHERGGRIHFDAALGCWHVSRGYEHHPVYWITWIGAAAYAAYAAARLPTHGELNLATRGAVATNVNYAVGDVLPAAERDRPDGDVHHLVGNLQVWCGNGPSGDRVRPVQRHLHGAAWNTPGSREEITRLRSRHLLGSSRGVGVRLARDPGQQPPGLSAAELAARLQHWLAALTARQRPLPYLDHLVVEALRQLQPDVGFRAHV
jgi:hypothetical protein